MQLESSKADAEATGPGRGPEPGAGPAMELLGVIERSRHDLDRVLGSPTRRGEGEGALFTWSLALEGVTGRLQNAGAAIDPMRVTRWHILGTDPRIVHAVIAEIAHFNERHQRFDPSQMMRGRIVALDMGANRLVLQMERPTHAPSGPVVVLTEAAFEALMARITPHADEAVSPAFHEL